MGRRRKNAPVLSDEENPAVRNGANERERDRMRVLSKAFCKLKTTLPWVPPDTKLSKLDTLRLATCYIAHLRQILSEDDGDDVITRTIDIKPLPILTSDRCQGNNRLTSNGGCDNMMSSTNRTSDSRISGSDGSYVHPMNLTWPFSFNGRYNVSPSDLNRLSASQLSRSDLSQHDDTHTSSHMTLS